MSASLQGMSIFSEAECCSLPSRLFLGLSSSGMSRMADRTRACTVMQRCRQDVLASEQVQRIVALHRALHSGDWRHFFLVVATLPYLPSCLCHAFFDEVRKHAINSIVAAETGEQISMTG